MSLDKAIKQGREHRKNLKNPSSPLCRNHGECEFCRSNRTYANQKRKMKAEYNEF